MRKVSVLIALVLMLLASSAVAVPIASVNADYLRSVFSPVGGDYGLGVFDIVDTAQVVVEDIFNVQTNYPANAFTLNASLYQDQSAGGIADGIFKDGTLTINGLLTADVLTLRLTELYDGSGILVGVGDLQVNGGSLAPDFGPLGEIVQIEFAVVPSSIDDFSQLFTGLSNITLTPVPEPATLAVLALGGLVAFRKRK